MPTDIPTWPAAPVKAGGVCEGAPGIPGIAPIAGFVPLLAPATLLTMTEGQGVDSVAGS